MAEITDFGPRKTIFVLAIVVGCFAVLWPKIFYPMLTATVNPHPSSDACCEVIFESDVTAVDIMQEMCQNILKHHQVDPRVRDALKTTKLTTQSANLCREEVLARCGIDLSSFLAERERLGKTYKQVLEEIRSFNSSFCLKMNFGVPLSQLGTPHLIRYHILMPHSTIRQERRMPQHAGGFHPALRERGRAIPTSHIVPKIVERPDHVIPKMRPPLGGGGHVAAAQKGNGTMGIVLPLYTIGIVLFFLYTVVKVLKKNPGNEMASEYSSPQAEKEFRKMVFNPETFATAMASETLHYRKERSSSSSRMAPTIEELKDLDGAPKSNGLAGVDRYSKDDTTADHTQSKEDKEVENIENSPTVKVMGMEMTASCEGGQKCSRPTTPIIPASPSQLEREKTPPKPIYLEGALPSQCELLVTDSETQAEKTEEDAEAPVVLSGKMTLSLISLDQIAAESEDEEKKMEQENGTNCAQIDAKTVQNEEKNEKVCAYAKSNNEDEETKDVRSDVTMFFENRAEPNKKDEVFVHGDGDLVQEMKKQEEQMIQREEEMEEEEEGEEEEEEVEEEEIEYEEEEVEEIEVEEDEEGEEEEEEEEEEIEEAQLDEAEIQGLVEDAEQEEDEEEVEDVELEEDEEEVEEVEDEEEEEEEMIEDDDEEEEVEEMEEDDEEEIEEQEAGKITQKHKKIEKQTM